MKQYAIHYLHLLFISNQCTQFTEEQSYASAITSSLGSIYSFSPMLDNILKHINGTGLEQKSWKYTGEKWKRY